MERWDGDVRGSGVGDASVASPDLQELLDLTARAHWVAEQPEVHLEGHIRAAARVSGLSIAATRTTDEGLFEVALTHEPSMKRSAVRMAAWGIVAAIAEATTHVREVSASRAMEFRVVTGMPDDVSGFASHGHCVVLKVAPGQ